MKSIWLHTLKEVGYKEVNWRDMTEEQLNKSIYVEKYLNPSVQHGRTGWHHIVYKVFENNGGYKEEYILICPYNDSDNGAKCVCVTANSLSAIAQAVWNNID